jgi:hypothetical protein
VALELMNEPMSLRRRALYDTWHAAGEAVNAVVPDLAVSVTDVGEVFELPHWFVKLAGGGIDISDSAMAWIKRSGTAFYSWHWPNPATNLHAEDRILQLMADWHVPSALTECYSCASWHTAAAQNMSRFFWSYSPYCTTGPVYGNRSVPEDTFGACILGWGQASWMMGEGTCDRPSARATPPAVHQGRADTGKQTSSIVV